MRFSTIGYTHAAKDIKRTESGGFRELSVDEIEAVSGGRVNGYFTDRDNNGLPEITVRGPNGGYWDLGDNNSIDPGSISLLANIYGNYEGGTVGFDQLSDGDYSDVAIIFGLDGIVVNGDPGGGNPGGGYIFVPSAPNAPDGSNDGVGGEYNGIGGPDSSDESEREVDTSAIEPMTAEQKIAVEEFKKTITKIDAAVNNEGPDL